MIKSNEIYSTSRYLEEVLGEYYIPNGNDDIAFIEDMVGDELWNYPFEEIDHIVENKIDVVLVECLVYNKEKMEYNKVLRWCEV